MDKDSERRRLTKMRTSLWVVILIHITAMFWGDMAVYLGVITMDSLIFLSMLAALRRDLDALEVKLPEPEPRSTKPRRPAMK